jgi:hypothetical protein
LPSSFLNDDSKWLEAISKKIQVPLAALQSGSSGTGFPNLRTCYVYDPLSRQAGNLIVF